MPAAVSRRPKANPLLRKLSPQTRASGMAGFQVRRALDALDEHLIGEPFAWSFQRAVDPAPSAAGVVAARRKRGVV